jgi:hypothetical protein
LRPDAAFASVDSFRPQTRDLFIASGDVGFWQAAIRDPADRDYAGVREAGEARRPFLIQLLHADHEGGQLSISLFRALAARRLRMALLRGPASVDRPT